MQGNKLTTEDKEKIQEQLSGVIEDLMPNLGIDLSEYIITNLGIRGPACCHDGDNKTGFNYYYDSGRWKCFTRECDKKYGNDIIGLIRAIKNCGFKQALIFAKEFLIKNRVPDIKIIPETKIIKIIKKTDPWLDHINQKIYDDYVLTKLSSALIYCKQRGLNEELFTNIGIGFAKIGKHLKGRVVVPIRNFNGKLVGFTGRKAYDNMPGPKWLHVGFDTSVNLFNIDRAKDIIKKTGYIILCEGPWDVLKFNMAGFFNAVAIFGVNLQDEQLKIINKCGVQNICLALDNDKAGNATENKNSQKIERSMSGLYIIKSEKDRDFGAMTVDEIKNAVRIAKIPLEEAK